MGHTCLLRLLAVFWLVARFSASADAQVQERVVPPPPIKTRVTIQANDMPAAIAAQEIARSSGVSITAADDSVLAGALPVTLNATEQPFWIVMQDYLRQAGLTASAVRTQGVPKITLTRSQPGQSPLPYSASGPFVYFARAAVRTQSIDYTQVQKVEDTTRLLIRAMIDPQIAAIAHSESLSISEALDENGQLLVTPDRLNSRPTMIRSDGELSSVEFIVPLEARSTNARRVKSLKGKARFQLATQEELWEVPDISSATGVSRPFRGGKYTIGALTPDPNNTSQYILNVHIDFDPAVLGRGSPASPLIELGSVRSAIQIIDVGGRALQLRGSNARNPAQGSRDLNIWYYMAGAPDDPNSIAAKLKWRIPSELITVEIPIELSDLALP